MSAPAAISAAAEPESSGVIGYQPETPFLLDGSALTTAHPSNGVVSPRESAASSQTESPFVAEYVTDGTREDPRAEAFANLIGELEDEEFEEAVTDLVHEVAALAEERFSFEGGNPVSERIEAERGLREYLEPLAQECEAMVGRMMEGLGTADLTTMPEAELEELLDRFAPGPTSLPPTLDQFGGSFFNKIKKGVVAAAKLGLKFSPIHILLSRLQKMAPKIMERVLQVALYKLPESVRPFARQLARRLLKQAGVMEAMETEAQPSAEDPASIAHELDARIAGYTLEGENFDRWTAEENFAADQEAGSDPLRELQYERAQFARDITQLEEGENPGPVVERFVPAILAALKLGIKLIGRPKVIKFLGGYLAQLIGKYVGKAQAIPLSRALVDTGLKLVNLETGEAELESGYALASTLEDTITRVAQEAPETAWESEELLEAYVREAFQASASAHFPDSMIRTELHEAAQSSGAWVLLPPGTRHKHYKKYTRVLEVTVTPQMAAAVRSFGGTPLEAVLRDQLGLPAGRSFSARVHLYEAVAGSTLPDMAMHEKGVRGLGSSRREAWSHIHPLTPEAAGMLLREPGLGRTVEPSFLADRNTITVGQRFYFLEIGHAQPRLIGGPRRTRRPARYSQSRVTLHFPKSEVRVSLFFSEAEAQTLSTQLRAKAPAGVVLAALNAGLRARLDLLFSGTPTRSLRIIHEAIPMEQFQSPAIGSVIRAIGRRLSHLLRRWLLEALKRELEQRRDQFAAQFNRATAAEADGVTLVIVFRQPAFMAPLRQLIRGGLPAVGPALAGALGHRAVGEYSLTITPGYVRAPVKR